MFRKLIVSLILLTGMPSIVCAQSTQIGFSAAANYFMTSRHAYFGGYGYPNQFTGQLGVTAKLDLHKRFAIALSVDYYQRREKFPCIYFPDGSEPLRNLNPLINHPVYICDAASDTRIHFIDLPVTVYYYFADNSSAVRMFIGLSVGPQFQLAREVSITELNSGNVLANDYGSRDPFRLSWTRSSLLYGLEKRMTEHLTIMGQLGFRTDDLRLKDNTLALGVALLYRL